MPKRSRKTPKDINKLAAFIVDETTRDREKNPAAVSLGRLGGLSGKIVESADDSYLIHGFLHDREHRKTNEN